MITLHNDPMITARYNDNHTMSCLFDLFPSCFFPFLDSSPSEYLQLGVSSGLNLSLGQRKRIPLMLVPEFIQNIQIFPGHMKVTGLCQNLGVMCYIQTTQLSVGVEKSVKLIQLSNVSARAPQ